MISSVAFNNTGLINILQGSVVLQGGGSLSAGTVAATPGFIVLSQETSISMAR